MKKRRDATSGLRTLPVGTRVVTVICFALALIITLVPLVWLVMSSFKEDPLAQPGFQLPKELYFGGYISTFRDLHVMRFFGNSMFIATVSVVISVMMISMSAYGGPIPFTARAVSLLPVTTLFIPPRRDLSSIQSNQQPGPAAHAAG